MKFYFVPIKERSDRTNDHRENSMRCSHQPVQGISSVNHCRLLKHILYLAICNLVHYFLDIFRFFEVFKSLVNARK